MKRSNNTETKSRISRTLFSLVAAVTFLTCAGHFTAMAMKHFDNHGRWHTESVESNRRIGEILQWSINPFSNISIESSSAQAASSVNKEFTMSSLDLPGFDATSISDQASNEEFELESAMGSLVPSFSNAAIADCKTNSNFFVENLVKTNSVSQKDISNSDEEMILLFNEAQQ